MAEQCAAMDVSQLYVLGDVFDSRVAIDLAVLDQVCRAFSDAYVNGLNLTLLVGNHDSYLRDARLNALQVFRGVAKIIDKPTVTDSGIGLVPWSDSLDELRAGVAQVKADGAIVLMTHALLQGVTSSRNGVPLDALQPDQFGHVWLGDVHDPVKVASNVQYAGSLLQIDFRDAGGQRGFWVVDHDDGEHEFVANYKSPRFHVITEPADDMVDFVRPGDFVRAKTENPHDAKLIVEQARTIGAWADSTTVEVDDAAPRLKLAGNESQAEVLTKFIEHVRPEIDAMSKDAFLQRGLGLLEEAKV